MSKNVRYDVLITLHETPSEYFIIGCLPAFWGVFALGWVPGFPSTFENSIIVGGASVVVAVVCYTYARWVKRVPVKMTRLARALFYTGATLLCIVFPLYVVYK